MKICHDESEGLSILNDATGQLEDAVYLEHANGRCEVVLFDHAYHRLALAKREAMRAGEGESVRARWVISVKRPDGGAETRHPRVHFADWPTKVGAKTGLLDTCLGGATLNLSRREIPTLGEVRALNEDPEHPLWDTYLAMLDPDTSEPKDTP